MLGTRRQVSWTGKELVGSVSQSAQFAPYDDGYEYDNTTASCQVYDKAQTYLNDYKVRCLADSRPKPKLTRNASRSQGGVYQQAVSGVTYTNPEAYADEGAVFSTVRSSLPRLYRARADLLARLDSQYGWEANAGAAADGSDGYVTWMVDDKKAWNMDASAVAPNPRTQVSQRLVSREPMVSAAVDADS